MDDPNKPVSASNYLVSMDKAGYTERSIAAIIDLSILSIGTWVFSIVFGITIGWFLHLIPFLGGIISTAITGLATFLFPILYNSIFEGGKLGSTPGKIYCGLAVRHQSGRKLTYKEAAIRGFGKYISWVSFMLGYALAFVRKDRKALHDFFIDSIVIDKGLGHEKLKKVINDVEDQIQDNIKELRQDLKEYTDD
tara:strand:+ start:1608 stop:2189 length:582 start_codon:yes stop_codon:yes gene_type:complete